MDKERKMSEERGTLAPTEHHPSAPFAMEYIHKLKLAGRLNIYQEAFASCAIENNRLAEVCSETLRRVIDGEPVSDRYLLGLCWAIRDMEAEPTREENKRLRSGEFICKRCGLRKDADNFFKDIPF